MFLEPVEQVVVQHWARRGHQAEIATRCFITEIDAQVRLKPWPKVRHRLAADIVAETTWLLLIQ